MISKQDLKDYQFEDIYDYYDYIVSSYFNGQFSQMCGLINNLSDKQYKTFIIDFILSDYPDNDNPKLLAQIVKYRRG